MSKAQHGLFSDLYQLHRSSCRVGIINLEMQTSSDFCFCKILNESLTFDYESVCSQNAHASDAITTDNCQARRVPPCSIPPSTESSNNTGTTDAFFTARQRPHVLGDTTDTRIQHTQIKEAITGEGGFIPGLENVSANCCKANTCKASRTIRTFSQSILGEPSTHLVTGRHIVTCMICSYLYLPILGGI